MTPRSIGAAGAALVLSLVSVLAPLPGRAAAATEPGWLQRVNVIRADAGENAVRSDPGGIAGLRNHMTYLARTPARLMTGRYASAHTENPKSRYYTRSGAKEAASSDLAFGTRSDAQALTAWLEAPFHAIGILRSALRTITFYRDPRTGDAGLDVISGLSGPTTARAVFFPQKSTTLSRFGGESPNPIQTCRHQHPHADYSRAGLPLVALLPGLASQKRLSATMVQPGGRTVSTASAGLCLVDAQDFYSTDSIYGPTGRAILQDDHAVLLIPRTPLRRGTYVIHLHLGAKYHGHLSAWSFRSTL